MCFLCLFVANPFRLTFSIVKSACLTFMIGFCVCITASAQQPSIAWRNIWVTEYEPNDSEKALLAPSTEIEQQFADFLRLPDTGLIRMYPPLRRRVISVAELATGRRPGFGMYASLYSFSKAKHGRLISNSRARSSRWRRRSLNRARSLSV